MVLGLGLRVRPHYHGGGVAEDHGAVVQGLRLGD